MTNFDVHYLTLGCNLDTWNNHGKKEAISIDLSPQNNSHMLLCGMSGSGKSYMEQAILAKLSLAEPDGEIFFADYKGDDSFLHLRNCSRYYSYLDSLCALDAVHSKLLMRQSGEDTTRNPVTLIFDEYMAAVLNLLAQDKKNAAAVMGKVSEILLLGRSLSVRFICVCQRPDALAFPAGSRLNYGIVCVLGAAVRSIYEMLLPDFREEVQGRQFGRGEGVVLLQGSELRYIKVPTVQDSRRMKELCAAALSRRPPREA
ncbi:MAG: ATP-binding protein [Oscillospiraceae bacterium]|nr:ATP-binding protein [Oscillospiraceae bacterium]